MTTQELSQLRNELACVCGCCADLLEYLKHRTHTNSHEDRQIADTVTTQTQRLNARSPTGLTIPRHRHPTRVLPIA